MRHYDAEQKLLFNVLYSIIFSGSEIAGHADPAAASAASESDAKPRAQPDPRQSSDAGADPERTDGATATACAARCPTSLASSTQPAGTHNYHLITNTSRTMRVRSRLGRIFVLSWNFLLNTLSL